MTSVEKNRAKNYFLVAWKELAVIAAVLFLDLFSKFLVHRYMDLFQKKVFIKGFFSFYYRLNTEAAVGFDFWLGDRLGTDGLRILFIVFISLAVVIFAFFLVRARKDSFLLRLPLALIIGGALGNFYDRIVHHAVRDFIHFEFFGKRIFGFDYFPTFNLADSALVIGVILFMIYFIFVDPKVQKQKENEKRQREKADAEAKAAADTEAKAAAEAAENAAAERAARTNEYGDEWPEIGAGRKGRTYDHTQFFDSKTEGKSANKNDSSAVNKAGNKTGSGAQGTVINNSERRIENAAADGIGSLAGDSLDAELIDSEGLAVELVGSGRARKVITETIITETIITETKNTKSIKKG